MIDSTFKNAKILIVDDFPSNVEILEELLEIEGYKNVKSTNDSREVLGLYKSYKPDLILLDLSMPHLTGYDVLEQLKLAENPHSFLPVIVLTANDSNEAKIKSLSFGANDFLAKPFDLMEVALRIKNMLYVSFLQQQLQSQNEVLDLKVIERTLALENSNNELIIAKEKAEENNRLKTAFLNNISHEIRTPLNGILGFGQLLSDENISPKNRTKYLTLLDESSIRLINTVSNFLDVSQLQSKSQSVLIQNFVPELVIEEIVNIFNERNTKKELSINHQTPINTFDLQINTDKDLLYKILYHLVENALKFTNEGNIKIGFVKEGINLLFFITDTGIGISEQNKNKIFNEFVQGDTSINRGYEGSGLGLSLAKGYVELLGGKIWLDSELGKGTSFYFSLPIGLIEHEMSNHVLEETLNTYIGKNTILIAEDDAINYFLLERNLKHDNLILLHAKNGQEAVNMCKENDSIQLVFMDLKMPVLDGIEATKEIKTFRKNLPIIALTSYPENKLKQQAIQAGCMDFISKPINKEMLFVKLKEFGIEV
jgi:two-component system sensor histidine kinase/response regulator